MSQTISNVFLPSAMETKLVQISQRQAVIAVSRALALGLSVLIIAMVVAMLIDWQFTLFNTYVRLALTVTSLLLAAGTCLTLGLPAVLVALKRLRAASSADAEIPQLEERWQTVVSMVESGHYSKSPTAIAMLQQVTSEAVAIGRFVQPRRVADQTSLKTALKSLAVSLLILMGFLAIDWRQTSVLLRRFLAPTANISATSLSCPSGDMTVARGEFVDLVGEMSGLQRASAMLSIHRSGTRPEMIEVIADPKRANPFFHRLQADESFVYQMRAGDGQTTAYTVTVIDYPALAEVRLTVVSPAYLNRPNIEKSVFPARLKVLEGSLLHLQMRPKNPLLRLELTISTENVARDKSTTAPMVLQLTANADGWYEFQTQLMENISLSPQLWNEHGLTNEDQTVCRIQVIVDNAPVARVLNSSEEMSVANDEVVDIKFEAHDDHGIAKAELVIYDETTREEGKPAEILEVLPIPLGDHRLEKHVIETTQLDLKKLNLKPGTQISYSVRVTDNRSVSQEATSNFEKGMESDNQNQMQPDSNSKTASSDSPKKTAGSKPERPSDGGNPNQASNDPDETSDQTTSTDKTAATDKSTNKSKNPNGQKSGNSVSHPEESNDIASTDPEGATETADANENKTSIRRSKNPRSATLNSEPTEQSSTANNIDADQVSNDPDKDSSEANSADKSTNNSKNPSIKKSGKSASRSDESNDMESTDTEGAIESADTQESKTAKSHSKIPRSGLPDSERTVQSSTANGTDADQSSNDPDASSDETTASDKTADTDKLTNKSKSLSNKKSGESANRPDKSNNEAMTDSEDGTNTNIGNESKTPQREPNTGSTENVDPNNPSNRPDSESTDRPTVEGQKPRKSSDSNKDTTSKSSSKTLGSTSKTTPDKSEESEKSNLAKDAQGGNPTADETDRKQPNSKETRKAAKQSASLPQNAPPADQSSNDNPNDQANGETDHENEADIRPTAQNEDPSMSREKMESPKQSGQSQPQQKKKLPQGDLDLAPPPAKMMVRNPQQSSEGQDSETKRQRLKITARLSAIAESRQTRNAETGNIRERVVELDQLLTEVESGLTTVVNREIPDDDRSSHFKIMDKRLGNVEEKISILRKRTRDGQYAFVGLQMVDIGRSHVTPARERVFMAIREPAIGSDRNSRGALQQVIRARELLAALLKKYDRVVQDEKLADSLEQGIKIYEVYVEKMQELMREAQQTRNPLERKMAILEIGQDYLDRYAEVETMRRDMMDEFARILGDDPRLLARYLDLVKRRRTSLRNQLTDLAKRQQETLAELDGWFNADEIQRQDLWAVALELRMQASTQLAKDAAELNERIEKQFPLVLDATHRTQGKVIELAHQIAETARGISLDARRQIRQPETPIDLRPKSVQLVQQFVDLDAMLERLNFENPNLPEVNNYVTSRLLESRTVADQAESWRQTADFVYEKKYHRLSEVDQHRLAIATELLRLDMLGIETELSAQFQRLAEKSVPEEIASVIRELQQVMLEITFDQSGATFALSKDQLPTADLLQKESVAAFAKAEELFDRVRVATAKALDEVAVPNPNVAELEDPKLDEFLAQLEREPNIEARLGIPDRPRNLRVIADTMTWEQTGGQMLGESEEAARGRSQDSINQRGESGKPEEKPREEGNDPSPQERQEREQAKEMEEKLLKALAENKERSKDPAIDPAELQKLEEQAKELQQKLDKLMQETSPETLAKQLKEELAKTLAAMKENADDPAKLEKHKEQAKDLQQKLDKLMQETSAGTLAKQLKEDLAKTLAAIKEDAEQPTKEPVDTGKIEQLTKDLERVVEQVSNEPSTDNRWKLVTEYERKKQVLKALARGEHIPDEQWNKLLSKLEDGLWQTGGRTLPEEYRKAIEQYQEQIRRLTNDPDEKRR